MKTFDFFKLPYVRRCLVGYALLGFLLIACSTQSPAPVLPSPTVFAPIRQNYMEQEGCSFLAVSGNGDYLAVVTRENGLSMYDSNSFEPVWFVEGDFRDAVFSPTNDLLAVRSSEMIILFAVESGQTLAILEEVPSVKFPIQGGLAFSPDGKQLASGVSPNDIHIWDVHHESVEHVLRPDHNTPKKLGEAQCELSGLAPYWDVTWSPDGQSLATAFCNMIVVWNMKTKQAQHVLGGLDVWVSRLAFSPNGKYLATDARDAMQIWDAQSGDLRYTLPMPLGYGYAAGLAWSLDSQYLAISPGTRKWILLDSKTGARIHEYTDPTFSDTSNYVKGMGFSPDGTALYIGSESMIEYWLIMKR